MLIAKWGNSLAVRIPVDVAKALGLREGDEVQLRALKDGELAVITEQERRRAAIARLREMAVPFLSDYKFDRDEANAR